MKRESKIMAVVIAACVVCICLIALITGGIGEKSIAGTWKVNGYKYDGVNYKASDVMELCELRGYSLLDWSETTIKFTKSGTVYMTREEGGEAHEITGTYTVGDTFIELCSADGERKLLDYEGNKIYYDIPSGVTLIFQK